MKEGLGVDKWVICHKKLQFVVHICGERIQADWIYQACDSCAPYCDVICDPSGSTIFFDINP